MRMKQKVIAIVGPTAVGKTSMSIEIAKTFDGEIISGDAMQVYKGMDIGTAKITESEMQGIPHYMIDIKNPDETFSAADFKSYVQMYITDIAARGKVPIIVGGSGLYIQGALYDFNFSKHKRNHAIVHKLERILAKEGIEPLYNKLKTIDPKQAEKIHPNNHRRVIRALEIYEATGMTMAERQRQQNTETPYDIFFVGLQMERKLLYERINARVDKMIKEGLVDEVRSLYEKGYEHCQSMQAIGYKEFLPYFRHERSLEKSIDILKRNSRRYAKRQYTWFKNKMKVTWYTMVPGEVDKQRRNILRDLAGFLKKE